MKNRRSVLAVGAILLAVVLLIAFAVPFARTGVFYIALGFEIAAFLVALFAAYVAFEKGEDTRSRFYGFPKVVQSGCDLSSGYSVRIWQFSPRQHAALSCRK